MPWRFRLSCLQSAWLLPHKDARGFGAFFVILFIALNCYISTDTRLRSGPFAPRELPRFLTTMGLSDSRPGSPRVMLSPWSVEGKSSTCRASQVPRPICPCAPPPITPESPMTAFTCCFVADSRLHPIRRAGHSQLCNEAESSSLALRLTRLSARGFNG